MSDMIDSMVPSDYIFPCYWCGLTRDSSRPHGYHLRCWFKWRWSLLVWKFGRQ